MKVLIITNSYPTPKNPGGGIFVKKQVESLSSFGELELKVFYNPVFNWMPNPVEQKGVISHLIKYLFFIIAFTPFLLRRFDLIHAHQAFFPGALAYLHHLIWGTPYIVTSHGGDVDDMASLSTVVFKLIRRVFAASKKVIVVSSYYRTKIINEYQIDEGSIEVISCGVDLNFFKPTYEKKEMKIKLGLDASKYHLLFVSSLIESKRPLLFLESIKELDLPDVEGIIIGDGALFSSLHEFTKTNNMRVTFKGWMEPAELKIWYQAADIFVFPSVKEAFGLVGVEALASGTPIVSTGIGGIDDYLQNQMNGTQFEVDDLSDLRDQLRELLTNRELYKRLASNAMSSVQLFDIKNIAQRIRELYLCP